MSDVPFVPFTVRQASNGLTEFLEPLQGVPDFLAEELAGWCITAMAEPGDTPTIRNLKKISFALRRPWTMSIYEDAYNRGHLTREDAGDLEVELVAMDDEMLNVVDYLLQHPTALAGERAEELDALLQQAHSAYGVLVLNPSAEAQLVTRIDRIAMQVVSDIVLQDVPGADKLAGAWSALHGRAPDFSRAHDLAIKAVEGALWETVTPRNPKARIGTIAATLFAQGEKWTMGFDEHFVRQLGPGQELKSGNQPTTSQCMVLGVMVQQLLSGQVDHHNTGPNAGAKITQEAATAAVALATAILQMTRAGTIKLNA